MAQDMKPGVEQAGSVMISWCYRSIAASDLDVSDILRIVQAAQIQNGKLGITGVLFFANRQFLQWLEGPEAAVEQVMSHILRDPRHHDIEVLSKESVSHRRFGDWHMQLSCGESDAELLSLGERSQVVVVDEALVTDSPAPAPMERVLAVRRFLTDLCNSNDLPHAAQIPQLPRPVATLALRAVPNRVAQRVALSDTVATLTDLLAQPDPLSRLGAIEALFRDYGPTPADFARLYEAYAETLLESLREDGPSMMQVALGAAALQMVLRRIHHVPDPQKSHGAVTVAAVPGELHFLEATISGEMLRAAGWSTSVLYPQNDADLIDRLKLTQATTLVLAASHLDPADHDDRLMRLISRLNAHPELQRLRIVVGGRLAHLPEEKLQELGVASRFEHLLDATTAVVQVACPDGADCCSMRACRQPAMHCCDKRITSSFLLANVMPSVRERMVERRQVRRA